MRPWKKAAAGLLWGLFTASLLVSCAGPAQSQPGIGSPSVRVSPDRTPGGENTASPGTGAPRAQSSPAADAVVYFTLVLHLEGWKDGENEQAFTRHAELLREYAGLVEQYGGVMTLESKEIIDGCIRWDDNVLYELQQRGHAIGIHADAGGQPGATAAGIRTTIEDMKDKLESLGITVRFVSGVASRADWVRACREAGMKAVTCMIQYGLWSLDPSLRPDCFEPFDTPAAGHLPYPPDITDRLHPWLADSGSDWIRHDPEGTLIIIPQGLSLNNAYEEMQSEEAVVKTEFTAEDIGTWEAILPTVLEEAQPGRVNTFYAVWSFGQAVDTVLLERWLQVIDGYVRQGRIRWAAIPEIIDAYEAGLK